MYDDTTQQTEPIRKSILDVLEENLNTANRLNFVHRLIYIGSHTFPLQRGKTVGDEMEKIVGKINKQYHDEYISGLLVCYPKYFCHMIEGSEDTIIKHLLMMTLTCKQADNFGVMKVLVCYHHINQRFLPGWLAITGKPPSLLERIDRDLEVDRTYRHVYACIQKLYKLAYLQRPRNKATKTPMTSPVSSCSQPSPRDKAKGTAVSYFETQYPDCLPEFGLLEFLLQTQHTININNYINTYGLVPSIDVYKDKVWPVPPEFVPYHIFDEPRDPATDLPFSSQMEPVGPGIEN